MPSADSTWDEIEDDENTNPNTTVRISLRSGEIRYKNGISKKMVVMETRGTPKREAITNVRDSAHSAGPSGLDQTRANHASLPSVTNSGE